MRLTQGGIQRVVAARLDPGEDLLGGIREAISEAGLRSGVILSGVGSVSRYRLHVVRTSNLPPGDIFFEGEGPFDILSITGLVLDGRVHAHLTLSNTERAIGGHLEEGCRILTFAAITLGDLAGADLQDWDRVGATPLRETLGHDATDASAGS